MGGRCGRSESFFFDLGGGRKRGRAEETGGEIARREAGGFFVPISWRTGERGVSVAIERVGRDKGTDSVFPWKRNTNAPANKTAARAAPPAKRTGVIVLCYPSRAIKSRICYASEGGGHGLVVKRLPSKQQSGVRFSLPAQKQRGKREAFGEYVLQEGEESKAGGGEAAAPWGAATPRPGRSHTAKCRYARILPM